MAKRRKNKQNMAAANAQQQQTTQANSATPQTSNAPQRKFLFALESKCDARLVSILTAQSPLSSDAFDLAEAKDFKRVVK